MFNEPPPNESLANEPLANEPLAKLALPAEVLPFPVEPAYRIRPDLRRIKPGGRHFVSDDRWPYYLARKLRLLETDSARCRLITTDSPSSTHANALMAALWEVAGLLALEQPQRFCLEDDRFTIRDLGLQLTRDGSYSEVDYCADGVLTDRVRRHLSALEPLERLADSIALAVQEDYVVIAGPPGSDRSELLHVCLPSHWNPGDRRGASFAEFHAPVPHNSRLLAGSRNLLAAMLSKGPFERFVWSLTDDAELDQNPARRSADRAFAAPAVGQGDLIDLLWFRSERQTTRPLAAAVSGGRSPADLGLFTIRIHVAPLRRVLDPGRAAQLASAIRSMDEKLLSYKGLANRRDALLAELDAFAARVE